MGDSRLDADDLRRCRSVSRSDNCVTANVVRNGFHPTSLPSTIGQAVGMARQEGAPRLHGGWVHISSVGGIVVSVEITVPEVAEVLGVSARRVRQLIDAGRLRARRVGRQWLVDGASLPTGPRRSRPMSVRVAWAFLAGDEPTDPAAARRWHQRRRRLADDPEPESVLASWVASRGERLALAGREPGAVVADSRLVRSGLSDPRAQLSAADLAEGWVSAADLDMFCRDHLLRPTTATPSVVVHVAPATITVLGPVPLLLLAADLADHHQPRPTARARDLIGQALA